MKEDKQEICDKLAAALKKTRYAWDLVALEYDEKAETVAARFANGGTKWVNVAADSGFAMVRDIVGGL